MKKKRSPPLKEVSRRHPVAPKVHAHKAVAPVRKVAQVPVLKPSAPVPSIQPVAKTALYSNSPQDYTHSPGEGTQSHATYLKPLAPALEKPETVRLDLVPKVAEE